LGTSDHYHLGSGSAGERPKRLHDEIAELRQNLLGPVETGGSISNMEEKAAIVKAIAKWEPASE